ncbi:MAG: PQQ-like beta-propeller repeat protein [Kiritimatiellales bacterium]|nr:PQQ-like beta-propeller repeat protein [Kiritimatiellales bacterium]
MVRNLILFAVMAGGLSIQADDWYTWRGPNANGISAETGWDAEAIKDGAKTLWKKELGKGYSTVSVKDGLLYTMGNQDDKDIIYCLDAKTGKEVWDYSYSCKPGQFAGPRATPVLDGGNVYTMSRDGLAICFDAKTGKVKWEMDANGKTGNDVIRWGYASSVVIEGDLLLLNIGEYGVALDKATGKIKWKSEGKAGFSTPVLFDYKGKRCAAIFSAKNLYAVEVATGKKEWSYEWETKYDVNAADPVFFDDKVFISSGYKRGCTLLDISGSTPKKVWENAILQNHFSSSVFVDGYIYGIDGNGKGKGSMRCILAKTGKEQWNMKIGFGSLMVADGKIIALGEKGTLYIAEVTPDAYKEIAQAETGLAKLCWTAPVLSNGIIYCRNDKGTLVAIDVGK